MFLTLEPIEKNMKTTDKEKVEALRTYNDPLAAAMADALASGMKTWQDYSNYVSEIGGRLDPRYGTLVHRAWIISNAYGDFLKGRLFWPADAYRDHVPCPCALFQPSKREGAMLALRAMVSEAKEHAKALDWEGAPENALDALASLDTLADDPRVFGNNI